MPYKDKEKRKLKSKELMAALYEKRRQWLDSLKEGVPCTRCGLTFPVYVMEWHHKDPSSKKFSITKGIHFSKEQVIEEISKCELYCANCHRIIEFMVS